MNLIFKALCGLLLVFSGCLIACNEQAPSTVTKNTGKHTNADKYSLYIMGKDGKEYILETDTLDSGELLPEQDGAAVDTRIVDRSIVVKNGYYYKINRKAGTFVKYNIQDKKFSQVAAFPLKDFAIENYHWMGGDTLLLTGLETKNFAQVEYVILRTGSMKIISAGKMEIPKPSGRFDNMSVGFVKPLGNHLLVGYTYHQQLSASDYTTSDTTYVTELNYPQMTRVKTAKDSRSTYPGGINTVQSSSFLDEQQDFYFMDCPGIALGNRPELSTAIMKIDKGAAVPDKKYFFNLSAAIHNHAYGMWYLGNGKAIVRSERKDLFKGLGDHYSTAHFEFYLVDVKTQQVVKKLELPLDKGTRRECVLMAGDYAYISINSSTKGNFIWKYNIHTGTLKKGLQLSGNTDYILRMDQLR